MRLYSLYLILNLSVYRRPSLYMIFVCYPNFRRNKVKRRRISLLAPVIMTGIMAVALAIVPVFALASGGSFIGQFNNVKPLPSPLPANSDITSYVVFVVPTTT